MADLTPSPDFPAIRIGKHSAYSESFADYWCRCGASNSATGDADVKALVADYEAHHGPAHRRERGRR